MIASWPQFEMTENAVFETNNENVEEHTIETWNDILKKVIDVVVTLKFQNKFRVKSDVVRREVRGST